jgi:hypothetical protein
MPLRTDSGKSYCGFQKLELAVIHRLQTLSQFKSNFSHIFRNVFPFRFDFGVWTLRETGQSLAARCTATPAGRKVHN